MPESFPFDPDEVPLRLLAWYGHRGRDLPWRRIFDPYPVWLSEIMLQQTTVAAAIPYFERFLERFPDLASLAAASLDEVIEAWAGLGYYSRARNLHAAARQVLAERGGVFPDSLEGLTALPGVGRSTAGAIRAIAFGKRGVILDGNVRRVLVRLFALAGDPRSSAAEKKLWQWAEALTPRERAGDYAQAIMDLGATVCLPRTPLCFECPLDGLCEARRLGRERELPESRKRAEVPTVIQAALLLERRGSLLVRRRPYEGLLGGLWEFPCAEAAAGERGEETARRLLADLGQEGPLSPAGEVRHAYSHFRLDLRLFRAEAMDHVRVAEGAESRWLSTAELAGFPLHGAHKKALKLLSSPRNRDREKT